MTPNTRSAFSLRTHNVIGVWSSDARRHVESAEQLLLELEAVSAQVKEQWPLPMSETVRNGEVDHPELYALVRRRDRISDSVRIFAALAVEGFLNYYGVVRLGEGAFKAHFERLGLIPKLRALLLVCDSMDISIDDPLCRLLTQLANARNSLAHPKAKEYPGYVPAEDRPGVSIPQAARDSVSTMRSFFEQFVLLVPESKHLVPPADTGA